MAITRRQSRGETNPTPSPKPPPRKRAPFKRRIFDDEEDEDAAKSTMMQRRMTLKQRLIQQQLPRQQQEEEKMEMEVKKEKEELIRSFEDCLKLIGNKRDEDRLEGLRLLPRYCKKDEKEKIWRVYDAISFRFLERLFRFSICEGGDKDVKNKRGLCLRIYVRTLKLFCHVEEIAANWTMVSRIPSILQIMERESSPDILFPCYEFLFRVSFVSKHGVTMILEKGGADVLATHLASFTSGSHKCALCVIGLMELIFCDVSQSNLFQMYLKELVTMLGCVACQVTLLENDHRYDLMYLLSFILPCPNLAPLRDALCSQANYELTTCLQAGAVHTLINHSGSFDKLSALRVVKSLVSMFGLIWLVEKGWLPLVLSQSKFAISSLLDGLWHLDLDARYSKSPVTLSKVKNLRVVFFLVNEINVQMPNIKEDYGDLDIFMVMNLELNETIALVLRYLKDAQVDRRKKGDDLLACVELVGSYFADKFWEAPSSLQETFMKLLDYMLFVEPDNATKYKEYIATSSLLPTLAAIAEDSVVAERLSSRCYIAVVNFLVELLHCGHWATTPAAEGEDDYRVSFACCTLLHLLLGQNRANAPPGVSDFVPLLNAFAFCTEGAEVRYLDVLASCICSLIFDATSEEELLQYVEINYKTFPGLSVLICRSMELLEEDMPEFASDSLLHKEILFNGYARWHRRFPSISRKKIP